MEEEGRRALDGRGVDLDKGGVAVEVDAFGPEIAFDVVGVEPDTAEPHRVEQLVDGLLVSRRVCCWQSQWAKGFCCGQDVWRVDGSALLVEAREVRACAADVEEWRAPVLEAFAGFALQRLLEAREHAFAVREGEGEAEGALGKLWVDIRVVEDVEGALETEALQTAGKGRFLEAVGVGE